MHSTSSPNACWEKSNFTKGRHGILGYGSFTGSRFCNSVHMPGFSCYYTYYHKIITYASKVPKYVVVLTSAISFSAIFAMGLFCFGFDYALPSHVPIFQNGSFHFMQGTKQYISDLTEITFKVVHTCHLIIL